MTTHIQYIDAYPGTGKTHWAINRMAQFLIEHITAVIEKREPDLDKHGQLFFYVAPTNNLIKEISASIKETVYNRIFNQTNDENRALDFSERAANRVYILTLESLAHTQQPISRLLTYAGRAYNENCKMMHECFKDQNGTSKYQFEPNAEPLTEREQSIYLTSDMQYFTGCVVFITQAAFWSANFSESSSMKTFYNRRSTNIIIDEARSCNCDSTEVSLSYDAYKYISSLSNSSSNDLNSYHKVDKSLFFEAEIRAKLSTMLSLDQFSKLYSFLNMYESASFFIKYNVKNTKAKTAQHPIKASLVVMQVPYAALIGWKDITLMSAFFKQSQLYAVIKCAKNIEQIGYDFNLVNITPFALDEDRIKLLHKRFQNATLTWIFDNYNNISKRVYNSGVVVRSDEFNAKNVYAEISKNFEILKSKESAELKTRNIANSAFTSRAEYSAYEQSLRYVKYSTVKDFLLNCPSKQLVDNFVHNNPTAIPVSPIEVAIRRTIEYAREWTFANNALFKNNKSKKLFKSQAAQSILINFNKTLGFGFNSYNVFTKLPSKLREQFTPLTTDARGLNLYKQFSIIAVLSAFNLPPDIKAWFDQYCCETLVKDGKKVLHCWYDQYQDIALGQVIQTMMRCSLRDTTLDNKVLIILSTKKIAYNINAIFNKSFNLKDPLELFPKVKGACSLVHASMAYDKTYDSVREELRAKKAAAQREYTNTSSYLKANLKSNTRKLTDEELCYKAYKVKYYDESELRKRYNSLYASRIYLRNKLDDYNDKNYILLDDDYEKYMQKLESLNEELIEVKKQSSMLLAQVKKDFKKKILEDFDAVYNDVKDYIDKVSKKRQKLAEYFENKLNNVSESKATSDAA